MSLKNNKSLGQHWLKDRMILDEIADEAMLDEKPGAAGMSERWRRQLERVDFAAV